MATTRKTKTKSKIGKSPINRLNVAEIKIAVTRFQDVLASDSPCAERGTSFLMTMRKKHPHVILRGDVIYVTSPGAIIRFTIGSAAGDKEKYYPLGIAFERKSERNTRNEQRLGLLNFPQSEIHPDRQTLTFTDSYKDDELNVRYKFSVIIQRGSDARIGIIDPGIVHEDET